MITHKANKSAIKSLWLCRFQTISTDKQMSYIWRKVTCKKCIKIKNKQD